MDLDFSHLMSTETLKGNALRPAHPSQGPERPALAQATQSYHCEAICDLQRLRGRTQKYPCLSLTISAEASGSQPSLAEPPTCVL